MIFLTIAVILAVGGMASAADVPEFIHICKRNSPDLDDCITESISHIRPYLVKGIPEFNIPALEPLLLEELVAVQGSGIKLSAKDINTYGSSDFTVSNMKVDLDKLVVAADVSLPHLYVVGKYHMEGKVLLLPISGSGPMRGNFTDCAGSFRMQAELRKSEAGEDHLYCTDFSVKFSVGAGNIHLEDLFGGERVLGDVVNSAINSNFDIFVKELKPLVEKALSAAFKDIANNIVKPFTYQQLVPDS